MLRKFCFSVFTLLALVCLSCGGGGGGSGGCGGSCDDDGDSGGVVQRLNLEVFSSPQGECPGAFRTIFVRIVNQEGKPVFIPNDIVVTIYGGDGKNLSPIPGLDSVTWATYVVLPDKDCGILLETLAVSVKGRADLGTVFVSPQIGCDAMYHVPEVFGLKAEGKKIYGTVRDITTKKPFFRVVEIIRTNTPAGTRQLWWVPTNKNGLFELDGMSPGVYTVKTLFPVWNVDGDKIFLTGEIEPVYITVK